jgi:hypothetical protein
MRLPDTAHTSRPWRIRERRFRIGPSNATCKRLTLTAGSYLKARVARTKLTFVTPPPDSMGP